MAYQPNLDPTPPSSVAPRHWWSRPMMTIPPSSERTVKYFAATYAPDFSALFTFGLVFLIFSFIHDAHSHAKISLQSLAVSSATWQADFLVKNPSSSYSIYYDGDSAAVRLGSRNAAILNITNQRVSRDHTAFSLSFVAEEGNRSNVVSEDLKIRLMGKHKRYTFDDEAGFFNIRCQHVTRGREKIICESSFTHFKLVPCFRASFTSHQEGLESQHHLSNQCTYHSSAYRSSPSKSKLESEASEVNHQKAISGSP